MKERKLKLTHLEGAYLLGSMIELDLGKHPTPSIRVAFQKLCMFLAGFSKSEVDESKALAMVEMRELIEAGLAPPFEWAQCVGCRKPIPPGEDHACKGPRVKVEAEYCMN